MSERRRIAGEADARAYAESWASEQAVQQLRQYAELLVAENQRQNLVSKPSESQLWERHIADSAQLLEHVPRETYAQGAPGPWLDLGTGPGLPGMVIAILCPGIEVVLVESRARRVEFLNACVTNLGLKNCKIEGQRLERVSPFRSWVISARAFAPLEKLIALSAPFSTKQTRYLLPKGRSAEHELSQAKPAIRKMFHVKHSLTDDEAGIIVSK
ncbi:16S rRNA (guanine(527)-N(7))-methyltransferase RsmG [Erythrobacter sp. KY5]|uniref:16S rRNA (guanine(527)-N(7))-methyltransferase RsmG n=1 Tax=Erythrobacter sp. KY5 TaxID=2011159 RepID=UPI000DBF3248|nr:16S rRNA (guanine(527)-N(7))-methyltransferase RsmG [Erythrobacter sp. KY5]AWW73204.1 16S rRNA (guanine(527)-N(7))-methyltransferase RsmG [Erythrobacter sp. KY5]